MPEITPKLSVNQHLFRKSFTPDDARLEDFQKKKLDFPDLIPGKEEEARTLLKKIIAPEFSADEIQPAHYRYLPDSARGISENNKFCCLYAAFNELRNCYRPDKPDGLHCHITFGGINGTTMHAKFMAGNTILGSCDAVLSLNGKGALDLRGADLSGADLYGAVLSGASLNGASLNGANLSGADLSGADLFQADLYRADLTGADLKKANLTGADLRVADLILADLTGANLTMADLTLVDLTLADLSGTIQNGTVLTWARLTGVTRDCRTEGTGQG